MKAPQPLIVTLLTSSLILSACNSSSSTESSSVAKVSTTENTNLDTGGIDLNNSARIEVIDNAGVDKSIITGNSVTLGTAAHSNTGTNTLDYSWSVISMPIGSIAELSSTTVITPMFTPDVAGTYTFELAINNGNTTTTDQVTITANEAVTSTAGILCDFNQSIVNNSQYVNAVSTSKWSCSKTTRELSANGLPEHSVGEFPNDNNPNTISTKTISVSFPLIPTKSKKTTYLSGKNEPIGYALNGVAINTSTTGSCSDFAVSKTECSLTDNTGSWDIEPLNTLNIKSFNFGTDINNANVQSNGTYHYQGIPEGFVELQDNNTPKMTIIGWAVDGFPIYARYGYSEQMDMTSSLKKINSSYQLTNNTSDTRPSTDIYPLGTFTQDWEYVERSGDLDKCNGRFGVTPEFPNGIFHYYTTEKFPYTLRCVSGTLKDKDTTVETTLLPPPPPA